MQTDACQLVMSRITHTRFGAPTHILRKKGLSVLIDLDRLDDAAKISPVFSVNRFNLFSFHERDFGVNHKSHPQAKTHPQPLNDYVRELARAHLGDIKISHIQLLAFPRICGVVFNPLTVYLCYDQEGDACLYIYEVHNTFGDAHSYISLVGKYAADRPHITDKQLHVSPFFGTNGQYRLSVKHRETIVKVLIGYEREKRRLLTAILDGKIQKLTTATLLKALFLSGYWPLRPLISIHIEAIKLFVKKCQFYKRPDPPMKVMTTTTPLTHEKAEY